MKISKLVDVNAVAEYYGVKPEDVLRLAEDGTIPSVIIPDCTLWIDLRKIQIEARLADKEAPPEDDENENLTCEGCVKLSYTVRKSRQYR